MMTLNRHQTPPCNLPDRRRGMTLLEVVVAITIVLIIMSGVVWSFVELLESHDKSRARMDATANARAAMEMLSSEVKRAKNTTGTLGIAFVGETISSSGGGDRIDQDEDGTIDEELFDGADTDGDYVVAADDRHVLIPSGAVQYAERPVFYQAADLDDANIDEDIGATSATVEFNTFDVPGDPLDRRVRFYIGSDADGQPNTLMREIRGTDPITSTTVVTSGPVCYNVVSFGMLFWNHANAKTASANPWETVWPPSGSSGATVTIAPSSVYMEVSVYSGTPYSLEELPVDREIETVSVTTTVNVEAVLADPSYVAQRTAVLPVTTGP